MNLKEFFKAWQETQKYPREYVVIETDDEVIKADWFDIQPESRTIAGGIEIVFLYCNHKRVAVIPVRDIKNIYCGGD